MSEENAKVGRPTKYTEDMPQKLIDYFSKPLFRKVLVQQATASGKIVEVEVEKPCLPPLMEGFCAFMKIGKTTFYEWVKKYPEFKNAFEVSKMHQAEKLATHALLNGYSSSISKLILANCTDYKEDKEEVKQEIKVVLPDVRAKEL
jgi:hypothetical protein